MDRKPYLAQARIVLSQSEPGDSSGHIRPLWTEHQTDYTRF